MVGGNRGRPFGGQCGVSPGAGYDAPARGCLGRPNFAVRSRLAVFEMRGITVMGAALLHSVGANGSSLRCAALQVDECRTSAR